MMDTAKRVIMFFSILCAVVHHVTGLCPASNLTQTINMCSQSSITGNAVFVDIPEMPRELASCSCSISTEDTQLVLFSTMEEEHKNCTLYSYTVTNPLSPTPHVWSCDTPDGFNFTSETLGRGEPWILNISKTDVGLVSAPVTDPGYCVVIVPTRGFGLVQIDCGDNTLVGDLPSTSASDATTTTTAAPTPTEQGGESTSTPSAKTTDPVTPGRLSSGDAGTDSGLLIAIGGITAGVILFFLIATSCYFYNRHMKRQERKDDSDRVSVITSTTNPAGYPYSQEGGRYVYHLDTAASSYRPDYIYVL